MTDELMSEIKAPKTDGSIIMVVGVGGAGGNAVNTCGTSVSGV